MLDDLVTPEDILLAAVSVKERGRGRNRQRRLGPSAAGDCKRRAWLGMKGVEPVNETKRMAAWMGSAIHTSIADGLRLLDPFEERFLIERKWETPQVVGSVDCYDMQTQTVMDWKSSKKASLGWLTKNPPTLGAGAKNWPSRQNWWQVHLYGWMLQQNGMGVKQVSLVGIARDGDEGHIRTETQEYDSWIAENALDWLIDVTDSEEIPDPEPSGLCKSYCSFYTPDGSLCSGPND
jgi:hypothetical protein